MSAAARKGSAWSRGAGGFTLIELLVVIAILAIALRMVVPIFTGEVPIAQVQAEARKLAAKLSYLRSEATLQGQRYGLEFEAPRAEEELHRYRIIMPREQQLLRDGEWSGERLPKELALEWEYLPSEVRFVGVHVGLADQDRAKQRRIFFDPRGRTAQKVIYIAHRSDPKIVFSVIVPPLTGKVDTKEGRAEFLTAVDSDF